LSSYLTFVGSFADTAIAEQERLPYAEGYTQSANSITGEFLGEVSAKIVAAIRSDKADSGGVCSR